MGLISHVPWWEDNAGHFEKIPNVLGWGENTVLELSSTQQPGVYRQSCTPSLKKVLDISTDAASNYCSLRLVTHCHQETWSLGGWWHRLSLLPHLWTWWLWGVNPGPSCRNWSLQVQDLGSMPQQDSWCEKAFTPHWLWVMFVDLWN